MSVDQKDVIDFISTSPNGKVVLRISDHLFWDEKNEHLLVLQDKINSYLRFIESGEIFESYPAANTSSLLIEVCLKYEPNETGLSFLNKCQEIILNTGIGFQWRKIN
ncbi:MAG: hypothetical protein HYZ42_09310 [Bacteroidetes bacterium]|nr:hypothetical protein [Bacteroidota bacterium]